MAAASRHGLPADGVARLAAIKARRGGAGDAPPPPPPRGGPLVKFFSEPVNAALVVGTAVGMARPLQKALFVSRASPPGCSPSSTAG